MKRVSHLSAHRVAVLAGVLVAVGLAAPTHAQDAVGGVLTGNCGGTSGLDCKTAGTDDSYTGTTHQAFVIDMGQYPTSWGNWYGYAPIKSSRNIEAIFMTNLISAQGASKRIVQPAMPASPLYDFWDMQGFGPGNPMSQLAPPAGDLYRLGAGFADFSNDAENIVSTTFEVVPSDNYNRLYVTRYESAVNKATELAPDNASFGFGSVDADGNPSFRADGFGVAGTDPLLGQNWISVNNSARTAGVVNDMFNPGGVGANTASDAAATSFVLDNGPTTSSPPTIIDAPGMSPLTAGGNFNGEYAYSDGTPPGVIATTAHLLPPATTGGQRGNMSFTHTFTGLGDGVNDAGTGAMLNKAGVGTDSMMIFGVNTDGSVDGNLLLTLPVGAGTMVDPIDGFDPIVNNITGTPADNGEFDHYHSQIAFSGGNGQALAGDRSDPSILYAAATAEYGTNIGGNDDPYNYIAVAKHDVSGGTTTWTVAAYTTNNGSLPLCSGNCADPGKAVLDGPGGNVIGVLLPLFTVTGCTTPWGPSISSPMLDTDGNLYFVAAWEKFLDTDTDGLCDATDPDSGLFKAHRDPITGGYELENIISLGNTIYGPNSDTRYRWRFTGVADSDSVSSGSAWSGNIVQDRLPGTLVNSLDTFDSGGLVINVSTVYDVDKDLDYDRPTGASPDDPLSSDEAYDMMIYVRGYVRTGACCDGASCTDVSEADCDLAGGTFNGVGTVCEFTTCGGDPPCPPADVDCSGTPDAGDILIVRGGANWNVLAGPAVPRADVDGSGVADAGDILVIRGGANWNVSFAPCSCP